MEKQTECKEVYLRYKLHNAYGVYTKHGLIIKETDTQIHFITRSETYRIRDEEYIDRKQTNGWYPLGTLTEIAVRKIENKPTCYKQTD